MDHDGLSYGRSVRLSRFRLFFGHLVLSLVGALNDGHLSQGGQIGQARVAGGREHLQLGQKAVDPSSLTGSTGATKIKSQLATDEHWGTFLK